MRRGGRAGFELQSKTRSVHTCNMTLPGSGPLSPKPIYGQQYNNLYNNPSRLQFSTPPPPLHNHVQTSSSAFPTSILGNGLLNNGLANTNGPATTAMHLAAQEENKIYTLVTELLDPNTREGALLELSKKREQYDDLALLLWHSFGAYCN